MAACSLGSASNIKLLHFRSELKKIRYTGLVTPYKTKWNRPEGLDGLRGIRYEPLHAAGFDRQHWRLTSPLVVSSRTSSPTAENDTEDVILEAKESNKEQTIPGSLEVESLLTTICDTTSIAEFKLNLAGFQLYVKRDLAVRSIPPPAPSPPLVQTNTSNQAPDLNGSASATSLAISKPKPSSEGIQRILDTASDEGLVILRSPKVGFFRKSRTIKGKRAPPSCKEKQQVKDGQVLCYIDQLGGEIPIESDVSGEVIKILRKDGDPVGYGDALMAILPSFPGIKKLQ